MPKELTIVIPVWNQWRYTAQCIASILKSDYPKEKYLITVVDNASTDMTNTLLSYLQDQGEPIYIIQEKENVGYLRGANDGWKTVETPYVLQANNDIILDSKCLSSMIKVFDLDPKIGVVGAIRTLSEDKIYPPKITFFRGKEYDEWEKKNKQNDCPETVLEIPDLNVPFIETDIVAFACAMVKREVWEKIGYFDELFLPTMYDQEDYSLRAKEVGFKDVVVPTAKYVHFGAITTSTNLPYFNSVCATNKVKFHQKWGEKLRQNLI